MAYYVLTCRETAHSLTPASFMVTAADCTRLRQGIAFSNLLTTRTLWYRRQTQVLDWVKYPM